MNYVSLLFLLVSIISMPLIGSIDKKNNMPLDHAKQEKELSIAQHALVGFTMGAADSLVTTPFYYLKNQLQLRQKARAENSPIPKIALSPATWFTGAGANTVGLIVVGQVQNSAFEALKSKQLSPITAASTAGALSASIACPYEFILRWMHNQTAHHTKTPQTSKESIFRMVSRFYNTNGIKPFFRGLGATMVRDAKFSTGYLVLMPSSKQAINNAHYEASTKKALSVFAGFGIGLITTIVTHPFDTIAGELQNDPYGKIYRTSMQAAKAIYQRNGAKGFCSGIVPRSLLISLSILTLDESKEKASNALKKALL